MTGKKRHHRSRTGCGRAHAAAGVAGLLAAMTVGCGTNLDRPIVYVDCGGAARTLAEEVVVLDWDGGVSALYPNSPFDGLDLSAFETTDGGTLADRAEEFKARVRERVAGIFCALPDHTISVLQKRDAAFAGAKTTVFFGQLKAPGGGAQVGEADYDPCNRYAADEAIIFGEQYMRLGGPYTFEDWVTMYANTTAHEIGHTLGYGHINRADRPDSAQTLFVELMLDRHTISELQQQQRIVVDQPTCFSGTPAARKVRNATDDPTGDEPADDLVFMCGQFTGR